MGNSHLLIEILQRELAAANLTYADVGKVIEASGKQAAHAVSSGTIRLAEIDEILKLLGMDLDDVLWEISTSTQSACDRTGRLDKK